MAELNFYVNINSSIISPTGASGCVRCSQALLFSMVNPHGLGPTKMPRIQNDMGGIYCNDSYGPTFGSGHDLHISGNANVNTPSSTYLSNSYQCPAGQNCYTFLAGDQYFPVADYEVFGLQK